MIEKKQVIIASVPLSAIDNKETWYIYLHGDLI